MKCWVDGNECKTISDGGLLFAKSIFCKNCHRLSHVKENLIDIFEKLEIGGELVINPKDQVDIADNAGLIIEAIKLLEEEKVKKISEIKEEEIQQDIAQDGRIIAATQFIKKQEKLLQDAEEWDAWSDLSFAVKQIIQESKKAIENIKNQIREELSVEEDNEELKSVRKLIVLFEGL